MTFFPTQTRTEAIVAATNRLLASGGHEALTYRLIAAESGVSASSLAQQLTNRERLLRTVAALTGDDLLETWGRRATRDGLVGLLPEDDDDLTDLRAWLSWVDRARTEVLLPEVVADVQERERDLVAWLVGAAPGSDLTTGVVACLHGLRVALCRPVEPLALTTARDVLLAQAPAHPSAA